MPLPSYPYPHSAPTLDVPPPQIGQLGLQLQQLNQQAPLVQAQTEHLGAQTQQLEQVRQDRQAIAQKFGMPVEAVDAALKTLEHIRDDATKVQFINRVFPGLNLKYDPASKDTFHDMSNGVRRTFHAAGGFTDVGTPLPDKPDTGITPYEDLRSGDETRVANAKKALQAEADIRNAGKTDTPQQVDDKIAVAYWNKKNGRPENAPATDAQKAEARALYNREVKTDPELAAARLALAQHNADRPYADPQQGRMDKSYQFTSAQLANLEKPIRERVDRLERLEISINQHTPQADSLIAPELLTAMAGGMGSGLRMNEAEISRIVGGRSVWETLKANLNKWNADPSKAVSITDSQRAQIKGLTDAMRVKVNNKLNALDKAREDLINAPDVSSHRSIYANTLKTLSATDEATTGGTPGELAVGTVVKGYRYKGGNKADKNSWEKVQ